MRALCCILTGGVCAQYCPFSLRINFNTFSRSFNAMFLVMTGEEWTTVMYAGMRLHKTPYAGVAFFVVTYALLTVSLSACRVTVLLAIV